MSKRHDALVRFINARIEYLSQAGWVPSTIAAVPCGPVWWIDPRQDDRRLRDDAAAAEQEGRDFNET